ncbi:MAG: hypothetical protein R3F56_08560 [Planctomycetota bacterium]
MLRPLAPVTVLALLGCVPKIESTTYETSYPLSSFHGPDSVPSAPPGTLDDASLAGPWRIVDVQHQDGDPTAEHLFQPGYYLLAGADRVSAIQGIPPEWYLPIGLEWQRNTIADGEMVLGFGFDEPRGDIGFLHYAFVMAAADDNHARAIEAFHFESGPFGTITWSIWSVDLERVQKPPDVLPAPSRPIWP